MRLYKRLLINNVKANLAFKSNFVIGTIFSFAEIIVTALIWTGFYRGADEVMGVALGEMLTYTVLNRLTIYLTDGGGIMYQINESVQDGSITERLTAPLGFMRYYILNALAAKPMQLAGRLFSIIPGALLFGARITAEPLMPLVYALMVALAFAIETGYEFVMGLSVLWLKNSFFLEWTDGLLSTLFAGYLVPMWFFPKWLDAIGRVLPFRYIVFEPTSILVGRTPPEQIPLVMSVSLAWAVALYAAAALMWRRGRRHLMINGG
ncbi:MAG: ABC-2 family transporter protein [Oscillospiraceae bacterium]|jgi:ABC-2 type transport system permease protein|nr:ABC-2 family transporter protein [Oscillospiraceae bacterium]